MIVAGRGGAETRSPHLVFHTGFSLGRGPASLARLTRHCLYNADQARGCPEEEWHGGDSTIPFHEARSLQFKCMRVV